MSVRSGREFPAAWLFAVIWIVLLPVAMPTQASDLSTWPGFRGEQRNGHVGWLPERLEKVSFLWSCPLPSEGNGGVAATHDFLVVSSRDARDQRDLYVCLDPVTGSELWQFSYASKLNLDYGNSPRATPLIADPYVYLLGAGGQLNCLDIDTGEVVWQKHLVDDLQGERPPWGYAASPLIVDNKLIVQPGGDEHAIAALDPKSGAVIWFSQADQSAYASPQVIKRNPNRIAPDKDLAGSDNAGLNSSSPMQDLMLLCWDRRSLLALDVATGKRVTEMTPEGTVEFHVPMPLIARDHVITVGEVNGTCRYGWTDKELLQPKPAAQCFELAPDMHSPVLAGELVLGVHESLYALDNKQQLEIKWQLDDPAFQGHSSLLVSQERLLVVTESSELILVDISDREDAAQDKSRILGRQQLDDRGQKSLAHPAMVDDVLFVRTKDRLVACKLME